VKLPAYPRTKPSGVEWLGDVPEHWEVKRAAAIGRFSSSGIDKKWIDGETPVQMFNYLDVYRSETKTLRYSKELMWTTAEPEKIREHAVRTGDILVTPSSETEDDIGHAAHVVEPQPHIVYSYHLVRFRVSADCDSRYLVYSINAPSVRSYFESVCSGTTRMVLVRDDMRNARFALPPLAEQRFIAAFLDRETGRVDRLVAKKRELIERLKEKRTALISRTVTRGLPPAASVAALPENPPLKRSALGWLGDIPEHWQIKQLKHLGVIVSGYAFSSADFCSSGVRVLKIANVQTLRLDWSDDSYLPEDFYGQHPDFVVRDGDVVFALTRPIISTGLKAAIAKVGNEQILLNQRNALFRPRQEVHRHFIYHVLFSLSFKAAFETQIDFTGQQPNISPIDIGNIKMPIPPLPEQAAIAAYLDEETAKLDALVGKVEEAVERLQEYRTALITAAVTGKIDVRKTLASQ
jgi:type I restriction enzyme S subunit